MHRLRCSSRRLGRLINAGAGTPSDKFNRCNRLGPRTGTQDPPPLSRSDLELLLHGSRRLKHDFKLNHQVPRCPPLHQLCK